MDDPYRLHEPTERSPLYDHFTLPPRRIYARISISATELEIARRRDVSLTQRMAAARLSPKLARKAWRRIRARRIWRIISADCAGIVRDLQRRGSVV